MSIIHRSQVASGQLSAKEMEARSIDDRVRGHLVLPVDVEVPSKARAVPLNALSGEPPARLSTGLRELDDVLSGGFVRGQSVLFLGERPGVGVTTLLLQIAVGLDAAGHTVCYASGEQMAKELAQHALRLGIRASPRLVVLADGIASEPSEITTAVEEAHADVFIVDSLWSVAHDDVDGDFGSPAQVHGAVNWFTSFAKLTDRVALLVDRRRHENYEDAEHLVDTVAHLGYDNDPECLGRMFSIPSKNRYGTTNHRARFRMMGCGLVPTPETP